MSRAVIRDDGRRYGSMAQAARSLMREQGLPPNPAYASQMASSISAACIGRTRKSAYGHEWRYAEERSLVELAEKVGELEREVEVLKCRMDMLSRRS